MSSRGIRQLYYVCAAISLAGDLIFKAIPSASPGEAIELFTKDFNIAPKEIAGPFTKKKTQILETTRKLVLTSQNKKAIYRDWVVTAWILKEPADQAYLVFHNRADAKKLPKPQGVITAPLTDLRFI